LTDSIKSGVDSYFDNIMDGLCGVVPDFKYSNFTSKDIVRPKA